MGRVRGGIEREKKKGNNNIRLHLLWEGETREQEAASRGKKWKKSNAEKFLSE